MSHIVGDPPVKGVADEEAHENAECSIPLKEGHSLSSENEKPGPLERLQEQFEELRLVLSQLRSDGESQHRQLLEWLDELEGYLIVENCMPVVRAEAVTPTSEAFTSNAGDPLASAQGSSPGSSPSHVTPVITTNLRRTKAYLVWIQKLSSRLVAISVNNSTSIMDVQCWLWENECIHPDQQRLTWQGKRLEPGRKMGDLGVGKKDTLQLMRVLPGAHGHECDLPILLIGEGDILVAHKLVHPDWLLCTEEEGRCGLVPHTHLSVLGKGGVPPTMTVIRCKIWHFPKTSDHARHQCNPVILGEQWISTSEQGAIRVVSGMKYEEGDGAPARRVGSLARKQSQIAPIGGSGSPGSNPSLTFSPSGTHLWATVKR
ncbi:hypothetical protein BKA70DRAFT_1539764 [Coprinopsis sp. MPI-PUGE-AT-0042]|nr:hypothetical protein BKA70DRAFT_1539764 [Coprinopsis sp. MPI-PUGE-AT-0042]